MCEFVIIDLPFKAWSALERENPTELKAMDCPTKIYFTGSFLRQFINSKQHYGGCQHSNTNNSKQSYLHNYHSLISFVF
jgi:hypothetical protein